MRILTALIGAAFIVCLGTGESLATCGGGGGGGVGGLEGGQIYTVPWQKGETNDPPVSDGLILYWFPYSDLDNSLRYSRLLSLYGARCVRLMVGQLKTPIGGKFAAGEQLPLAVLCQGDGTVIGKAGGNGGNINVDQVEKLLQSEMKNRALALSSKLDSGKNKEDAGDQKGAIEEYQTVLKQKCLFPRQASQASKRLKKLGVADVSVLPGANLDAQISALMQRKMMAGLQAELSDKYSAAAKLYQSAHKIDPYDPAPLRYLGELNRHDIGDWDKAREIFNQILALQSDPLSRAVALHGLGKMTIHEGDFQKGEKLIEESVRIYPLALAYRNLAVYWNSEGNFEKAKEYTHLALKQAPKDPFNVIFAAVFMAESGHKDEAVKIASENENLLPASYNLAAIYAQAGQKEKALALLKRHFYEYERNQSVRSKEMMEARVDKMFASLQDDPAFLALTSDADGKLLLRK